MLTLCPLSSKVTDDCNLLTFLSANANTLQEKKINQRNGKGAKDGQ